MPEKIGTKQKDSYKLISENALSKSYKCSKIFGRLLLRLVILNRSLYASNAFSIPYLYNSRNIRKSLQLLVRRLGFCVFAEAGNFDSSFTVTVKIINTNF